MDTPTPCIEMPRYKCHKEVYALKIGNIANRTIYPEDERYAPFAIDADFIAKHDPKVGGYYVVYTDGYKSFSPADAFESGYTKLNGAASSEFEIIADTTASILMWFDKNPEYIGTETAQIEIGHRVKSAIKRSTT